MAERMLDAYRVVDLLATKSVSVIAGPELIRTVEREDVNLPLELSVRGVPFGFQSSATSGAKNTAGLLRHRESNAHDARARTP